MLFCNVLMVVIVLLVAGPALAQNDPQLRGDPGPVGVGEAAAELNPETGELKISSNGVINVYVEHTKGLFTPISPSQGLLRFTLTNNQYRMGLTSLGPINTQNFSFGNVGAGLDYRDMQLIYTVGFGQPEVVIPFLCWSTVGCIPEPGSGSLIAMSLAGLMAVRRRRLDR